MRVGILVVAVLLCMFSGLGCSDKSNPARPAAGQLQGKLDAALALTDEAKRDESLASVAAEAAEGTRDLDPDFARECVKEAVEKIKNPTKKDDTAASCARSLSNRGHYAEATIIAKLIADDGKRDATLAAISKK